MLHPRLVSLCRRPPATLLTNRPHKVDRAAVATRRIPCYCSQEAGNRRLVNLCRRRSTVHTPMPPTPRLKRLDRAAVATRLIQRHCNPEADLPLILTLHPAARTPTLQGTSLRRHDRVAAASRRTLYNCSPEAGPPRALTRHLSLSPVPTSSISGIKNPCIHLVSLLRHLMTRFLQRSTKPLRNYPYIRKAQTPDLQYLASVPPPTPVDMHPMSLLSSLKSYHRQALPPPRTGNSLRSPRSMLAIPATLRHRRTKLLQQ